MIVDTLCALLNLSYSPLEIFIVDQSTDEHTSRAVAALAADDARVRHCPTVTVGSSAARNLGAHLSSAELVVYTDDDCLVSAEWLGAVVAEFRDPAVAAVYGCLLPYDRAERTGTEVGLKVTGYRERYHTRTPPWHIGHGGNMAFRRTELLAVGGFDPLLGAGGVLQSGEDADIAYRLLAAHKQIVYSPHAVAYHKHWKTWSAQQQMERAYGVGLGAQVMKYLRCGDRYGLHLLGRWLYELGLRRLGAGLLKWRSSKVCYLGYCQLVYPWLGIWKSRRYQIDPSSMTYRSPLTATDDKGAVGQ